MRYRTPIFARNLRSLSPRPKSGTVQFTTEALSGPAGTAGREIQVELEAGDAAFLLTGIAETYGVDAVVAALAVIETHLGQPGRIPVEELSGR